MVGADAAKVRPPLFLPMFVVVRFQLGMLGCLLAGCVMQPTPPTAGVRPGVGGSTANRATSSGQMEPPATVVLRIGVEHLPPTDGVETAPHCDRLSNEPAPARLAKGPHDDPRESGTFLGQKAVLAQKERAL